MNSTAEIVADAPHIKVTLNGTVITDADLSKIQKSIDGHDHPGLPNAKGYISWLGHGNPPDPVEFHNVCIKEFP
ncbi:MAG: family 16 glycoside hydrolase [Thermoguttaceae bacterium]